MDRNGLAGKVVAPFAGIWPGALDSSRCWAEDTCPRWRITTLVGSSAMNVPGDGGATSIASEMGRAAGRSAGRAAGRDAGTDSGFGPGVALRESRWGAVSTRWCGDSPMAVLAPPLQAKLLADLVLVVDALSQSLTLPSVSDSKPTLRVSVASLLSSTGSAER